MSESETTPNAFELQAGELGYGGQVVLTGLDVVVGHGELVGIVGRSGAGKSTFLAALAGAPVQLGGTHLVNGVDPRRSAHPVGLVPQIGDEVVTRLRVDELISLGAPRSGLFTSKAERAKATELIEQLGMSGFAHRRLDELSGGQRQRVAIARALMGSTNLLLCDEPTSGADPVLAAEIVDVLTAVAARGTTVLIATHDLTVVVPRLGRVIGFGSGRVVYDGPATDFSTAARAAVYGSVLWAGQVQ